MAEHSPDEYLNDPQFVQVLSTTLSLEIANKEKEIKETHRQIENLKSVLSSNVKDRKRLKQLTQIEQKNKIIFQSTLNNLRRVENEKILELSLLKEKIDDSLLKTQIHQERLLKILETYKETWSKYEAEYEQFPLAIERKKYRNEVERMKIQCMVEEYKKIEFEKMLNLRNGIDDRKIQLIIVKLSQKILERWNKQKKINELIDGWNKLKIKWNNICQQHQKVKAELEAEARRKALARLQMPPPRIDFSFMRAVYTESSPKDQFSYIKTLDKQSDPDSISVNTLMLEEICRDEPSVPSLVTQNTCEEENDAISLDAHEDDENLETSKKHLDNETTDANTETLEKVCRQLSITEETSEVYNSETHEKVPDQTKAQIHFESQLIQKTFSNEKINHLKKKAPADDSRHSSFEAVEKKKPKLDHRVEAFSQVQQDSQNQNLIQSRRSFLNDIQLPVSQPQIRNVETLSQPLNINLKPPMAEVPPTPSALYSPHRGSNYGSSTNLSHLMDPTLDDSDINWQDFPLSRVGSDISYVSTASMYTPKKPPVDNNAVKPISKPPDMNVNNFMNFFPTNKQTNNRLF